ncbi:acyl-CoA carboxylase subunit epsilon [Streptomyces sp. NPDC050658]|uniref:acyl-CoA carboxylase subunit epsilon n=1 Tax=unclassified Streptomyces TaxID=2593676 RepID=UPI00342F4B2B
MGQVRGVQEGAALLRVERGRATEEELAAVAVTLLSLAARRAGEGGGDAEPPGAGPWREAGDAGAYRAPHSWR